MTAVEGSERGSRLPDFLIIGAQKSGTTSLQWALNQHPRLHCIPERHFFCCRSGRHDLEWYRAQFAEAPPDAIVGEKCPCYLRREGAIEQISKTLPDVKLIAVLREPASRAYAQYWHERRRRTETRDPFTALAQLAPDPPGRDLAYIENSRYLPQLERVCRLFSREQLLVLIFEELLENPDRALREVSAFLGVEPFPAEVELPRINSYREYRPRWLFELMYRRHLWRFLPRRAAAALHRGMSRELEYPPPDPTIERALRAELEDDTRRLAGWLGRDLEPWGVEAPRRRKSGRFVLPEAVESAASREERV